MTPERLKEIKDEIAGAVCGMWPFDNSRHWVAIARDLLAEVEQLQAEVEQLKIGDGGFFWRDKP